MLQKPTDPRKKGLNNKSFGLRECMTPESKLKFNLYNIKSFREKADLLQRGLKEFPSYHCIEFIYKFSNTLFRVKTYFYFSILMGVSKTRLKINRSF